MTRPRLRHPHCIGISRDFRVYVVFVEEPENEADEEEKKDFPAENDEVHGPLTDPLIRVAFSTISRRRGSVK